MLGRHAEHYDVVRHRLLAELQEQLVHRHGSVGVQRLRGVALLEGVVDALLTVLELLRHRLEKLVQRRLGDDARTSDERARHTLGEPLLEVDEVQLSRRTDEREDTGRIVLSGNGNRDAVPLLALDLRLCDAKGVNAGAQDLHGLIHLLVGDGLALLRLSLERNLGTALEVETQHRGAQVRQQACADEQRQHGDENQDGSTAHALVLGVVGGVAVGLVILVHRRIIVVGSIAVGIVSVADH